MPAFRGYGILVYFAAYKDHIGISPPVEGDTSLDKAFARYRGPKGNLRFPFGEPMRYDLVESIANLRARQDFAKATTKKELPHPVTNGCSGSPIAIRLAHPATGSHAAIIASRPSTL